MNNPHGINYFADPIECNCGSSMTLEGYLTISEFGYRQATYICDASGETFNGVRESINPPRLDCDDE